jgi:hypothetical protein
MMAGIRRAWPAALRIAKIDEIVWRGTAARPISVFGASSRNQNYLYGKPT